MTMETHKSYINHHLPSLNPNIWGTPVTTCIFNVNSERIFPAGPAPLKAFPTKSRTASARATCSCSRSNTASGPFATWPTLEGATPNHRKTTGKPQENPSKKRMVFVGGKIPIYIDMDDDLGITLQESYFDDWATPWIFMDSNG